MKKISILLLLVPILVSCVNSTKKQTIDKGNVVHYQSKELKSLNEYIEGKIKRIYLNTEQKKLLEEQLPLINKDTCKSIDLKDGEYVQAILNNTKTNNQYTYDCNENKIIRFETKTTFQLHNETYEAISVYGLIDESNFYLLSLFIYDENHRKIYDHLYEKYISKNTTKDYTLYETINNGTTSKTYYYNDNTIIQTLDQEPFVSITTNDTNVELTIELDNTQLKKDSSDLFIKQNQNILNYLKTIDLKNTNNLLEQIRTYDSSIYNFQFTKYTNPTAHWKDEFVVNTEECKIINAFQQQSIHQDLEITYYTIYKEALQ